MVNFDVAARIDNGDDASCAMNTGPGETFELLFMLRVAPIHAMDGREI